MVTKTEGLHVGTRSYQTFLSETSRSFASRETGPWRPQRWRLYGVVETILNLNAGITSWVRICRLCFTRFGGIWPPESSSYKLKPSRKDSAWLQPLRASN